MKDVKISSPSHSLKEKREKRYPMRWEGKRGESSGLQEEETNGGEGTEEEAAGGDSVGGTAWDVGWDWEGGGVGGGVVWGWWNV